MFKSFQDFNEWWSLHVPTEIVTTISRAQSRVSALLNRLSTIVQDYTSAYNSVQTLGYDNQGSIQDQTSADRLTVPSNVLERMINNLRSQYQALMSDKKSFVHAYSSVTPFVGLAASVGPETSIGLSESVLPIYPCGSIIFRKDKSAQFIINAAAMQTLVRNYVNVPDRYAYASPMAVFKKVSDGSRIITCFYQSQTHYPQLPRSYNQQWQLIIFRVDAAHAKIYFEINLNGTIVCYLATISVVTTSDHDWVSDFTQPLMIGNRPFNSWSNFITFCNNNGLTLPDVVTDTWGITYNGSETIEVAQSDMTESQWSGFTGFFSQALGSYLDGSVASNTDEDIAGSVFESVIPVSTNDILDVIDTLS